MATPQPSDVQNATVPLHGNLFPAAQVIELTTLNMFAKRDSSNNSAVIVTHDTEHGTTTIEVSSAGNRTHYFWTCHDQNSQNYIANPHGVTIYRNLGNCDLVDSRPGRGYSRGLVIALAVLVALFGAALLLALLLWLLSMLKRRKKLRAEHARQQEVTAASNRGRRRLFGRNEPV